MELLEHDIPTGTSSLSASEQDERAGAGHDDEQEGPNRRWHVSVEPQIVTDRVAARQGLDQQVVTMTVLRRITSTATSAIADA